MTAPLIACHECDLLQQEAEVPARGTARCARCGAVLYRNQPESLDSALALSAAAGVLFVLANVFPLVGLEVQGELVQTTLFGASKALYQSGMATLGVVVLITTVVTPLIELVAMAWLLVPLRMNRRPAAAADLFRMMRAVQQWRMVEVMMLGVLVALVKLAHIAVVVPGIALWSLGALVVLLAACVATFEPRSMWARMAAAS